MAKTWAVCLPISGTVCVEVEAETEESAIEAALSGDLSLDDIEGWTAHKEMVRGNVFYGECREASAVCVDGDGDAV